MKMIKIHVRGAPCMHAAKRAAHKKHMDCNISFSYALNMVMYESNTI